MSQPSAAEDLLAAQMRLAGLPEPQRQARFVPGRKFAADFAWLEQGLIVEVQGGGHGYGRHHRAAGYAGDCARMAHAVELGWRVLYITPDQVRSGEALRWVQAALCAPLRPEPMPEPVRRARRSRGDLTAIGERCLGPLYREAVRARYAEAAPVLTAHYRCEHCRHEWTETDTGSIDTSGGMCPRCSMPTWPVVVTPWIVTQELAEGEDG